MKQEPTEVSTRTILESEIINGFSCYRIKFEIEKDDFEIRSRWNFRRNTRNWFESESGYRVTGHIGTIDTNFVSDSYIGNASYRFMPKLLENAARTVWFNVLQLNRVQRLERWKTQFYEEYKFRNFETRYMLASYRSSIPEKIEIVELYQANLIVSLYFLLLSWGILRSLRYVNTGGNLSSWINNNNDENAVIGNF